MKPFSVFKVFPKPLKEKHTNILPQGKNLSGFWFMDVLAYATTRWH